MQQVPKINRRDSRIIILLQLAPAGVQHFAIALQGRIGIDFHDLMGINPISPYSHFRAYKIGKSLFHSTHAEAETSIQ
jgi:hypothetical protein